MLEQSWTGSSMLLVVYFLMLLLSKRNSKHQSRAKFGKAVGCIRSLVSALAVNYASLNMYQLLRHQWLASLDSRTVGARPQFNDVQLVISGLSGIKRLLSYSGRFCFEKILWIQGFGLSRALHLKSASLAFDLRGVCTFTSCHFALCCPSSLANLTAEPAWHRRARKIRQIARSRLKKLVAFSKGRRSLKARQAIAILQRHHSWNPLEYSAWTLPKMSWTCKHCQQANHQQQQTCRGCKYHWTDIEAWYPKKNKKNRSQSRHQKRADKGSKQQSAKSQDTNDDLELSQLLSSKAPWVTTTPQTRVPKPSLAMDQPVSLPPQPVLPPPPPVPLVEEKQELTEEELRVLKTLQELSAMGIAMSEEQKHTVAQLENKQQQAMQTKGLNHGHLNRLGKTKRQLKAMASKVQTLDAEWEKFVQGTTSKIVNHATLYQSCRQQMVEAYQLKLKELAQATKDAKMASEALLGSMEDTPTLPVAPKIDDQLQAMQQVMTEATQANVTLDSAQIISDEEMEQELIADGELSKDSTKAVPKKTTAFKGAVAQQSCQSVSQAEINVDVQEGEGDEDSMHFPQMPGLPELGVSIRRSDYHALPCLTQCSTQNCTAVVPCRSARVGVDDMYSRAVTSIHESQNDVYTFLTQERQWSWSGDLPEKPRLKPRFASNVDVHVFHQDVTYSCKLDSSDASRILRRCWNMNEIKSSMSHVKQVLARAQSSQDLRLPENELQNPGTQSQSCSSDEGPDGIEQITQAWVRLSTECLRSDRPTRIVTWYLRTGDHETCTRPREVTVAPGMSQHQFQEVCRIAWNDVALPEAFEWHLVRDAPHSNPCIRAHVILAQRLLSEQVVHLIHWDQWPILFKFRAVLFRTGMSVRHVLEKVRHDGRRLMQNVRYGMFCNDRGHPVHLDQNDVIELQSATVLYGFLQHLPEPQESDSASDSVGSDVTTSVPESEEEYQDHDEVSWVATLAIKECFDQHGPLPWENRSDEDPEEQLQDEPMIPILDFARVDQQQMHQHAQYLRAGAERTTGPWVAVTFGVGLVHLGRRDLNFEWEELPMLHQRIRELWHDQLQYGRADLFFVTPQPDSLGPFKYLAFIVAVDYGYVDLEERKVLIRERSPDPVVANQPYAAVIRDQMSQAEILASLGHSQCFPFGIRDCHVRIAGRWIDSNEGNNIRDGDLCDIFVDKYPAHVEQAEDVVGNAERLFQVARSCFESISGDMLFVIRVHGISPSNQPLGHRDLHVDYPDLLSLQWLAQLKSLWPFREHTAACWYAPTGQFQLGELTQRPILHFVLSYVVDSEVCPVLIQQTLYEVNTQTQTQEVHAVAIPRDANEAVIKSQLTRFPFFFVEGTTTHIKHDGHRIPLNQNTWNAADVIELQLNVLSKEYMLKALWFVQQMANAPIEYEEASLMQLRQWSSDEILANDQLHSFQDSSFAEICVACKDFVADIRLTDVDPCVTSQQPNDKNGDSCGMAQPEDNSDLRKASPKSHVMQISLEKTLVDKPRQIDYDSQMFEWFQNGNWLQTLLQPWPETLSQLPEGVHIHAATWEALHCQVWHQSADIVQVELFVDGATAEVHAAWSVVMVTHCREGAQLQGVVAGTVATDSQDPRWIGATQATNVTAEVTALAVAQLLALSLQNEYEVCIRPDLQLSKHIAELHAGLQNDPALAATCDFLARFNNGNISVQEIRAHKSHPWNELADCVAKFTASTGQSCGVVPWDRLRTALDDTQEREWAWLQHATPALQQVFPPVFDSRVMQVPQRQDPEQITRSKPIVTEHNAKIEVKLCTINALAFDSSEANGIGSRVLRLDQQMHERGIVLLGLQETRTVAGRKVTDHYHIFSSGGSGHKDKQHFGCEVWIHKSLPLIQAQDGTTYKANDFKIVVVCADPRRLVLKLTGPLPIVVAALHAPCKSANNTFEDIHAWWSQTAEVLEAVKSHCMFLACDANAPLGEPVSRCHGAVGAEAMNDQGEMFAEFLQNAELGVPSTFGCHCGDHGTWRHPGGSLHRRDYVLVSISLLGAVRRTQVLTDVDLGFSHVDHYPVLCEVAAAVKVGTKCQRFQWDRKKFRDQQIRQAFQNELASLPIPRWDVSVDEHNSYFNEHVLRIAKKHFAQDGPNQKHRPQLTEPTRHLLGFKRQVLGMMRRAQGVEFDELKSHLRHIEKQLRQAVWRDQRAWYDEWVSELDLQSSRCNTAEVYRMLQRLGKKKKSNATGPRPLPLLQNGQGGYATSHEEMQAIWCQQFAKLEAGLRITDDELVDIHLDGPEVGQHDIDARMVPGLHQLAKLVRKLRNGRVAGPNGILPEVLKSGEDVLLMHLLPIVSKAILHSREPLEWKGSALIPLFKGRGDPANPMEHRSIYVADSTAKIHHGWIRMFLEEQWTQQQSSIQLGGRKGVGADTAHHLIQCSLAWARQSARSAGILFLDLRAAFYSVHRAALMERPYNDQMLVLAMKHHGIMPDDWAEIRDQIEKDNATQGISQHAETVLADMFHGTHFHMGEGHQVLTQKGTRPGDPVGDILFNMLFSIIMKQSRCQFLESTDFTWVGQPEPLTSLDQMRPMPSKAYLDLAYVDDAAFVLLSPDPLEMVHSIQTIASIVHDNARLRGLDVNYGQGKTEVLVKLAGKGARTAREQLWGKMNAKIPVLTEHGAQQLHAVRVYKHLGTTIQDHAAPTKEVRRRIAEARQAEGRLHRSFFTKKCVSLKTKTDVFRALVCSRHRFQAHTWSWINKDDISHWEDGIREPVAVLCRGHLKRVPPYRLSTKGLCAIAGLEAPEDALHAARLKYCCRALSKAPQVLWRMILELKDPKAWCAALMQSVQWLRDFGPKTCRHLPLDLEGVVACMMVDKKFLGKITAARHSCHQFRRQCAKAQVQQLDIAITLAKYGVEVDSQTSPAMMWQCGLCQMMFDTKRGLAMHSVLTHGYRRRAKYWVTSDECLACGRKYFCRARAIAHVQSNDRCMQAYIDCFPPLTDEEAQELDGIDRLYASEMKKQGWHPTKAFRPPLRIPGPCIPTAGTQDAHDMKQKWELKTHTNARGFEHMMGDCLGDIDREQDDSHDDRILAFVGNSEAGAQSGKLGIFQDTGLTKLCAQIQIRSRIFLHLFSGYRRENDLQQQLEALSQEGQTLHCVSIDICLARDHCDLLCAQTIGFWKDKMRDGWVAGIGGGPPCETFTAARLEEGGPPPLRSYDFPWGFQSLTRRQWAQVDTGTALVFAIYDLVLCALVHGLCAFVEHPGFPVWKQRQRPCSIWAWRVSSWFSKLQCVQITTTDQCLYGCPGKKPTTFMTVRLPLFRRLARNRGHQGRCNHWAKHVNLIGRDQSGKFKTERAKIYPAQLNRDLALAIAQFMKETAAMPCSHEPQFLAQLQNHEFIPDDVVQKDYHGWLLLFSFLPGMDHGCMIAKWATAYRTLKVKKVKNFFGFGRSI